MRKQIDWNEYLYGMPREDYVFDKRSREEQLELAASFINDADRILIGAGAGLSAAAGLVYSGERFEKNFPDFIRKYGLTDMYSSTFYPYPSEEARWAYWTRHVMLNRITPPPLEVYKTIHEIAGDKSFVLTTNVDHQFWKAGFRDEEIFATQGDYGLIQCAHACHDSTYDAVKMFRQMDQAMKDCLVPKYMVPTCPVCGGRMEMNLRKDQYFVEDEHWHEACARYASFLEENKHSKVVMLELGVGFNTPMIIRFPFERMLEKRKNWTLVRLNMDQAFILAGLKNRAVGIDGDIAVVIDELERKVTHESGRTA